nr:MAG TPA: hypothetical protein [Caudoviricetes sp.]
MDRLFCHAVMEREDQRIASLAELIMGRRFTG